MSDETTARGFRIYADILDSHGQSVRVQESSAVGHVWIFAASSDGASVMHWKPGGGWESTPRPGDLDPTPWSEGEPLRPVSEGWQSVSPHLGPDDVRALIAALQEHLAAVEGN